MPLSFLGATSTSPAQQLPIPEQHISMSAQHDKMRYDYAELRSRLNLVG